MVFSRLCQNMSWLSRNFPQTLGQLWENLPHEKFEKLEKALKNANGEYLEAVKDLNATQAQTVVSPMQQPTPRKLKRPSQRQYTGHHPNLGLHDAGLFKVPAYACPPEPLEQQTTSPRLSSIPTWIHGPSAASSLSYVRPIGTSYPQSTKFETTAECPDLSTTTSYCFPSITTAIDTSVDAVGRLHGSATLRTSPSRPDGLLYERHSQCAIVTGME